MLPKRESIQNKNVSQVTLFSFNTHTSPIDLPTKKITNNNFNILFDHLNEILLTAHYPVISGAHFKNDSESLKKFTETLANKTGQPIQLDLFSASDIFNGKEVINPDNFLYYYSQFHRAGVLFKDQQVDFHVFEGNEVTLNWLYDFFTKHPNLLPSNLTVNFHRLRYRPGFDKQTEIENLMEVKTVNKKKKIYEAKIQQPITGTGKIDYQYQERMQDFARACWSSDLLSYARYSRALEADVPKSTGFNQILLSNGFNQNLISNPQLLYVDIIHALKVNPKLLEIFNKEYPVNNLPIPSFLTFYPPGQNKTKTNSSEARRLYKSGINLGLNSLNSPHIDFCSFFTSLFSKHNAQSHIPLEKKLPSGFFSKDNHVISYSSEDIKRSVQFEDEKPRTRSVITPRDSIYEKEEQEFIDKELDGWSPTRSIGFEF